MVGALAVALLLLLAPAFAGCDRTWPSLAERAQGLVCRLGANSAEQGQSRRIWPKHRMRVTAWNLERKGTQAIWLENPLTAFRNERVTPAPATQDMDVASGAPPNVRGE